MLGPKVKIPWLAKLDGPANAVQYVRIGTNKEDYVAINACRPHMCSVDNVVILYSPEKHVSYARLELSYQSQFLGEPPSELKSFLDQRSP